jgi:hypothetical protein
VGFYLRHSGGGGFVIFVVSWKNMWLFSTALTKCSIPRLNHQTIAWSKYLVVSKYAFRQRGFYVI